MEKTPLDELNEQNKQNERKHEGAVQIENMLLESYKFISAPTEKRIKLIAQRLHLNEQIAYLRVLFSALDHAQEHTSDTSAVRERDLPLWWKRFEPIFQRIARSKKTFSAFEKIYLNVAVSSEENDVERQLHDRIAVRLSAATLDKILEVTEWGKRKDYELWFPHAAAHLSDKAFKTWERDIFVPFLDGEIKKTTTAELVNAGLILTHPAMNERKKTQHEIVVECIGRLKKKRQNKNKGIGELICLAADELKKTPEATKRAFYYSPKKLQK